MLFRIYKHLKIIILRINSPGGSAIASEEIYKKLLEAKSKGKVIVASIGNMAASGGYFISLAADKIFANSTSLVGSIGVISQFPIFERFNKNLGITKQSISSGKHLDMFSGNRKLTQKEKQMINKLMDDTYQHF